MSDIFIISMKSTSRCWVLSIFFVLIFTQGCDEKPEPAVFPTLLTLPVTNIGSEGATFNVDLLDLGNQKITEFGFAWSESQNSDIIYDDRIFLNIPTGTGKISARISSAMEENEEYYVRSFIKTEEYLVYGTELKFVSKGSLAPVITSFSPDSAGWRDTITIRGLNYSFDRYKSNVYLGNVFCNVVSANDTVLRAVVSEIITSLENSVRVEVAGNSSNILIKKIKLIKPTFTDYQPRQVRWGDTLIIKGRKIKFVSNLFNKVQLGDLVCPVSFIYSDSCIGVIIPNTLANITNPLKLSLNGFEFNGSEPIELLSPYFEFSPKEATLGATITLEGRFNTNSNKYQLFLGTTPITVNSATFTKLVFVIPDSYSNPVSSIRYVAPPFEVTSTDEFKLTGPWRLIPTASGFFANRTGYYNRYNGISFTLKEKGYMIDLTPARMSSYNPSTNVKTTLNVHQSLEYLTGLTVIIHNDTAFLMQPKGNFDPSRFSYYDVSTGQWKSYGPSPSDFAYGGGFSLGGKIYYGLVRKTTDSYFSNAFKVYDKKYATWSSKSSFPWVENTYVAASFSYNEIGYILFANKKLYSYNPVANSWQYVGTWPATGITRYSPTVFVINNLFYFGLGYSYNDLKAYDDIWTYNPVTNQWTEVAKIPKSVRSGVLTFVAGGKAYIGYGVSTTASLTDFYEFDPSFLK